MCLRRIAVGMIVLAGCCGLAAMGQAQAVKSDADVKTESDQAQALYDKGNFVAALPLYEELHGARPANTLFEERLAMALLGGSGQPAPAEAKAIRLRAKTLLLDARAKGDDSNLSQVLLEKLDQIEQAGDPAPVAGKEWFDKGEAAFGKGDLAGAVGFYSKALEVNPQYYFAATYAGDAEFKMNHPAEAGKFFAQAIAIDPDIETAHRYWGDCLEKDGDHQRAEEQFIEAIVADPYSKSPRVGLKQWAERNHARVVPPPIILPKRAEPDAKGNTNINLDPSTLTRPGAAAWIVYMMAPTQWKNGEFAKHYPKEKVYRHSLAEEASALRDVLALVNEQKLPTTEDKLDTTLKMLIELDKNGMLECWILLDDADQGIAQDYVAYRKDHRELMAKYIAQYDVHAM
jgi:tetratricopeptide (TPR) repeat protein